MHHSTQYIYITQYFVKLSTNRSMLTETQKLKLRTFLRIQSTRLVGQSTGNLQKLVKTTLTQQMICMFVESIKTHSMQRSTFLKQRTHRSIVTMRNSQEIHHTRLTLLRQTGQTQQLQLHTRVSRNMIQSIQKIRKRIMIIRSLKQRNF